MWTSELPMVEGWYWMLLEGEKVLPVWIGPSKRGRWVEKVAGGHRTLTQEERSSALWSPIAPPPEIPR